MTYRDLYANPGSRLRISIGTHMGLWIRWGWSAQYQFSIGWRWWFERFKGSRARGWSFGPLHWMAWR